MADDKQPKPPKAFSSADYNKLDLAILCLRDTQLGALIEPFLLAEVTHLFVRPSYRAGLSLVYQLESPSNQKGTIYVDVNSMVEREVFPTDNTAKAYVQEAVVRLSFDRASHPGQDGFVTPEPVFGTMTNPIRNLQECSPLLRSHFENRMRMLHQIVSEWGMVRWVFERLQNSVRTPEQVRYVWPAIQTLAKVAELEMDLSTPSARAGMNARPSPDVLPYLRATNDVVLNSTLMGDKKEYRERSVLRTIQMIKCRCSIGVSNKVINLV